MFINRNFQNAKVKLLVLGVHNLIADFGSLDLEIELNKDIDRIRFSKNVGLYENNDTNTVDDYLKNAENFSFKDTRVGKVIIRMIKFEDINKEYLEDFVDN